ncbi:hypothetical protein [Halalkalibacter akibai]|uniref:Transcriptional regulator n=1 Tax=Halalkalibacter akibai (strain ATCC 43226 / DSM 21942 / CIP 109018 / JCM 9157 / 1139) TaxID=1236973 RepID=W4QSX6_HALA3|nr:hypothetical protein [Halalkalibacter akibai]GAE34997.1 transcriptional regulator [Halalkalibacter akibai JCM 9157]
MKSGHIKSFTHLSQFTSVKEFNESTKQVLQLYRDQFTKKEQTALLTLIQYSVKYFGICNARIDILVAAANSDKTSLSRTTFERMLRKAKALDILSIHSTIREKKGGNSHNVYVFHRFDGAQSPKLTERSTSEKPFPPTTPLKESKEEAKKIKASKNLKDKELRNSAVESLDFTFVPSYVPKEFIKLVKPFFNRAKEICALWDRVLMAHRNTKTTHTPSFFLPTITQAFKETVYQYKQNRIKTSFMQYFYGTLFNQMVNELRRSVLAVEKWGWWLEGLGGVI